MAGLRMPLVLVRRLGRVKYQDAFKTQQTLMTSMVDHLGDGKDIPQDESLQDTMFICEHDPVYTNGRRAKNLDNQLLQDRFKALGAEYYQVDRGGLITFHGPGQLVCYPVFNLNHFKPSLKWYVHLLEEVIINTCRSYGIDTVRTPDTGIWIGNNKICAMGIQATRMVTMHGLALNCNTDLNWFNHIVPCGLHGKGVTSLTEQLGREVTIEEASVPFLSAFADAFQSQLVEDVCSDSPS